MLPSLRRGRLYIVFHLVMSSVVGMSEVWERFVVCIEAGAALLHCVGFVAVFCMSSCTGVEGDDVSQQYYCFGY